MLDAIKRKFLGPTLKSSIRLYESLLGNRIGCFQFDPKSVVENYKNSKNPDPQITEAYALHAERDNINFDHLKEAKKKLSRENYYKLLQELIWRKNLEGMQFNLWRDLYSKCSKEGCHVTVGGIMGFGDAANIPLKLPYGYEHELPERMPEVLYLHSCIVDDPRCAGVDQVFDFPEKMKKKIRRFEKQYREHPDSEIPRFYGDPGKICAIRYFAKDAYLPTGGIIQDIKDYYEKMNFKPLEYDLACPWTKGGLASGWGGGRFWSQCWIDDSGDAVLVFMMIGGSLGGEVKVFVMHCPYAYCKEAVDFYRSLHPENSAVSETLQVPRYSEFKINPIPSFGYGLAEEIVFWRNKVVSV